MGNGEGVLFEHGIEEVDEFALGDFDWGVEGDFAGGGAFDDDVDVQRAADIFDEGGEFDGFGEGTEGDGWLFFGAEGVG